MMLWWTLWVLLIAGCGSDDFTTATATFEFVHGFEPEAPTYRATTSNAELIALARAELGRPLVQRTKQISGPIAAGAGEDNAPWNWHFEPDAWTLIDLSAEVCDGEPSYVSEHLDEWIEDVGTYCPWSSRLSREL
jgi:hypothetical protein